jgi:protocatechuate 3,4-dioxygenase beta subunit
VSVRLLPLACLLLGFVLWPVAAQAAQSSCPDSNPPNELVLGGGTPQTAQLGHAFQSSFAVALANTNGCPLTGQLAGVTIDFKAPADGPSGTFGNGGTNTITVGTDASGRAVAPAFTANDTAGTYSVSAVSGYGTVSFWVTNSVNGVSASIAPSGGSGQTAAVGTRYGQPLTARVLDPAGKPVQGAAVAFVITPGTYGAGGSFLGGGAQATAETDASGLATSPPLVANGTPGPFTATATTSGVAEPASFALSNAVAATTLTAQDRTLTAAAGKTYAQRLRVKVLDASGSPVVGAAVAFAIVAAHSGAGASFADGGAQATAYANADGIATSPALVASTTAGSFTATASIPGGSTAAFALRNTATEPTSLTAGAAASQSTSLHARFPVRLAVTVTDADGNPVSGAVVTFTAPRHGASGRFSGRRVVRARSNAHGVAIAPAFRANGTAGGYVVVARVRGLAHGAAFALVNLPRTR